MYGRWRRRRRRRGRMLAGRSGGQGTGATPTGGNARATATRHRPHTTLRLISPRTTTTGHSAPPVLLSANPSRRHHDHTRPFPCPSVCRVLFSPSITRAHVVCPTTVAFAARRQPDRIIRRPLRRGDRPAAPPPPPPPKPPPPPPPPPRPVVVSRCGGYTVHLRRRRPATNHRRRRSNRS